MHLSRILHNLDTDGVGGVKPADETGNFSVEAPGSSWDKVVMGSC